MAKENNKQENAVEEKTAEKKTEVAEQLKNEEAKAEVQTIPLNRSLSTGDSLSTQPAKNVTQSAGLGIKEKKDKKKEEKPKKTEAVVNGTSLPISTKHSMAICDAIRGKKIDKALSFLEEVLKFKKAVPMKGEIPHRKGNIMSGRYPINATKQFIKLLKQLSANATTNEIDLENAYLAECKPNRASRPYKRFGSMRFKRTHVTLRLKVKQGKK